MNVSEHVKTIVRQLHAEGFSFRKIARIAGINRDTVRWIIVGEAKGEREYERVKHEQPDRMLLPNMHRPAVRCPGCGARVHMPCLKCTLEGRGKR